MKTFTLSELKSFWGIESDEVVGQFVPKNEHTKYSIFGNLMGFSSKGKGFVLMHPVTVRRFTLNADLHNDTLVPYKYYRFSLISAAGDAIVTVDKTKPIDECPENPYQEIVRNQFYEYSAPKSDITVANLLGEISNRLYSSNDRVFYEIIQNADDMPTQRIDGSDCSVRVEIQNSETYTIIMYNSLPFNQQDVESITSAAQSTKLYQKKKTGYKGIGFKSIFTDTLKHVIIRSGGFQFKFDREAAIFKDFEGMYINNHPWQGDTPESRRKFLQAHQERMDDFLDIGNIPWQLKPLWVDYIDQELKNSDYRKAKHNVAIAIKRSATDTQAFVGDLVQVCQDSRFLLYLRNLNEVVLNGQLPIRLSSRRSLVNGTNFIRETRVRIDRNGKLEYDYCVWQTRVECSDQSFSDAGLDLRYSTERKAGHDRRVIVDTDGNKRDIPDKLASFDEVQLYFAAPIYNDRIEVERAYSEGRNSSFIYTYLPMNDLRIRLPFRISADFVPSANREQIEGKNSWNHFILYNIGYQLVRWLKYLAESDRRGNYLGLLPQPLDSGDSTIVPAEEWFNKGYKIALKETAFISTYSSKGERELVTLDKVILNDSSLLELFDDSFFYAISNIDPEFRRLPIVGLDTTALKSNFFKEEFSLQLFTDADLISRLEIVDAITTLQHQLVKVDDKLYEAFLLSLSKLVSENQEKIKKFINTLPFIRFGSEVFSWNQLQTDTKRLVRSKRTQGIDDILIRLGIEVSDVDLSQFDFLFTSLATEHTYLSDNPKLFSFISAHTMANKLEPVEKRRLIDFFADESFKGVNKGSYAEKLLLFQGSNDSPLPLSKLIINKIVGLPRWILPYVISKQEQYVLGTFSTYLITEKTIFSRIFCEKDFVQSITATIQADEINDWADALIYYEGKAGIVNDDYPAGLFEIPWIYTTAKNGFKSAKEIHYNDALNVADASKVIELLTDWVLPHPKSWETIKHFKLQSHAKPISLTTAPLKIEIKLSVGDAWLLLDFLQAAKETNFFKKWRFVTSDAGFKLASAANIICYKADTSLKSLIGSNYQDTKLSPIPDSLSEHPALEKLGVLSGLLLIEWLIANKAVLDLTPFVANSPDLGLHEQFISRVKMALSSDLPYERAALESQFIRLTNQVHKRKEGDAAKTFIETVRANTLLNGDSLDKWRVNDRVRIGKKEIGFYSEFRLSELLPEKYKGVSDVVNRLVEKFSDSKSFVRNELLASKELSTTEVAQELRKLAYLSPLQVVFRQIQAKAENINNPLQGFKTFHQFLTEDKKIQELTDAYVAYLTIIEKEKFDESYIDFNLNKYVDASVRFNEVESLPDYLAAWADSQEKIEFLSNLKLMGKPNEISCFNGPDSSVVQLRKGMLMGKTGDMWETYFVSIKKQKLLVENTILWLTKQPDDIINRNLSAIKSLLNETVTLGWTQTYILVASEVTDERRNYQLKKWSGETLYFLRDDWNEHSRLIQQAIRKKGGWLIDGTTPDKIRLRAKPIDKAFESVIRPNLAELCRPFDANYYLDWESRGEYPVLIYETGQFLPYEIWYNGEYITDDSTTRRIHYLTGKTIFLTQSAIDDFPLERPEGIPYDIVDKLAKLKYTGTAKVTANTESDTDYDSKLDSIKQGQEHSKQEQRKWHAEAVKKGKAFLQVSAYNFSKFKAEKDPVYGEFHKEVINPEGLPITAYYRSAKGGLLYLNPTLWGNLGEDDTVLVIIYEDGQPKIFTTQNDLLEEKYNPYMLYRVKNDKQVESVNAIAKKLEDGTGHLLFVTGPAYQKRLSDILKSQPGDTPMEETSTGLANLSW